MFLQISDNSMKIWKLRYLEAGETIEQRLRAVAGGNEKFYRLMMDRKFLCNSPTIFNMGRNNGCTSSACFVFNVADNMRETADSIVATRDKAIAVAKAGGGVGYYFGFIRPKGSLIKSVQRVACGPVTVLRDYNAVERLITQGGKRDLAQMGVLNITHDDIEEFINCKNDNPQELKSFNISVSWDDHSLQQAFSDPHSRFADLWNKQVSSAWQTGCPGMLFFDAVNRTNYNKHLGLIYATNPSLRKGTRILTSRGVFPIEQLEGQDISVPNLNGKLSPAKCFLSGRNKELYEITLKGGRQFFATAEHKWPVVDRHGRINKVATADLKAADRLPISIRDDLGFGDQFSYDDGFLVGWIIGDGSITQRKDGRQQVGIYLSEEKRKCGPGRRLVQCLERLNCDAQFNKRDREGCAPFYEMHTVTTELNNLLHTVGYTDKEKGLPTTVWNIASEDFRKGLLDGLFSSDGCISKSNNKLKFTYTTTHEKLATDVMDLLGFYGIRSAIRKTEIDSASFPNGKIYDRTYARYDVTICGIEQVTRLAGLVTLTHSVKQEKLQAQQNIKKAHWDANYAKVVSVRKTDFKEDVWDISVYDDTHCFVLSGCVTGNCGETPNRSDEPCNLGSLNLARYYLSHNRDVDWDNLYVDAYTATEFLDDILDRNTFPHPDITRAALLTRKLGLGVMGWADLLALMHIHYDTDEAVELGARVMRTIQEAAREASMAMAKTKGPYAGFSDQSQMDCTRNETNTSVAPTGTIALLLDASSSIEPHYELEWERTTKEGVKLHERIPVWDHLEGFIPKTAMQIAPEWHIRHQAAFQQYTDLGVSKCVVGDTLVLTGTGWQEIQNLHPERGTDVFRSLKIPVCGEHSMTYTADFYSGGVRNTLRVHTRQGSVIEGTPNHRIRVERNEQVVWVRLDEIRHDDMVVIHTGQQVYSDKDMLTPDLACLLGHAVADGCLADNWLAIFHTDPEVIQERVQLFGIPEIRSIVTKGRNTRNTERTPFVKTDARSGVVSVQQNSRLMVKWLETDIGLKRRAANKTVPLAVLQSTWEVQRMFLRGLFTDCGVANRRSPNLMFNTASYKLARQVRAMLFNAGMYSTLHTHPVNGKDYYRLHLVVESVLKFAKEVGFVETTRTKQFQQWDNYKSKATNPNSSLPKPREGYRVEVVDKITTNKSPVFDISVPDGNHAFVTDGMISHNTINLPNNATKEDISKCYRLLYESGCKGGTIFRDGCRSEQVLVSKKGVSVFSTGLTAKLNSATEEQQKQIEAILNGQPTISETTRKLPTERQSITKRFKVGGVKCYMTVGLFEDGKPAEVFFRASKLGSTISGLLDTWAVNFSLSLRRGVPLEDLCRHHIGARFEPLGMTDDPNIPVCSSIPDFVVRWLQMRFLGIGKETETAQDSGLYCPECGKGLIYQSGCLICTDKSCGFSRCG